MGCVRPQRAAHRVVTDGLRAPAADLEHYIVKKSMLIFVLARIGVGNPFDTLSRLLGLLRGVAILVGGGLALEKSKALDHSTTTSNVVSETGDGDVLRMLERQLQQARATASLLLGGGKS